MTRLWLEGMPLRVTLDAQGKLQRFFWQGRSYRIEHIWRQWLIDADWWSDRGQVWREYLIVSTQDGVLCQLYHDMQRKEWYLVRVYN